MKKYHLAIVFVVLAILLAGCGGGGKAASNSIQVTMTDFHFTPTTFTVNAGQEIKFSGKNNGAVTHDFIIMKAGVDVGDSFDKEDEPNVFWKIEIPSGQSSEATFTAPAEAGEYQVLCGIPGHYQAGMSATLTVAAP